MGDCSVKLQREADRSGPSMLTPTARPEAAARQTACDRLSLCVWVRAGAGRLWRRVKNVESLLSARELREEADFPQECVKSGNSGHEDVWSGWGSRLGVS